MILTLCYHLSDQQFHSNLYLPRTTEAFGSVRRLQQVDSVDQSRGVEDSETFLDHCLYVQNSAQICLQLCRQRCDGFHSRTRKYFHHRRLQHRQESRGHPGWNLAVQSGQGAVQLMCRPTGSGCLYQQ